MYKQEYITDNNGLEVLLREDKAQVMMEWEKPYMEAIINTIKPSGHVLEIGFGCGYSATAIQQYKPKSHTIIECHPVVLEKLGDWSQQYKNINIVDGYWQQQLHKLGNFDFIFFDDYPLEVFDEIHKENKFNSSLQDNRLGMFIDICLDWHMEIGSSLSAYLEIAGDIYENSNFKSSLTKNPKIDYSEKIISVEVPPNCKYYRGGDKAVIPLIKKIS
jgi:hypothetical protein